MKKKLLAVAMVLCCLAIVTGGSLAYFTAEKKAHNVITTGSIDIEDVYKRQSLIVAAYKGERRTGSSPAAWKSLAVAAWGILYVRQPAVLQAGVDSPHRFKNKTPGLQYTTSVKLVKDGNCLLYTSVYWESVSK